MIKSSISLYAIHGIPLVQPDDDLASLIVDALQAVNLLDLMDNDVIVIAQKIVSKAERAIVILAEVTPGQEAFSLAEKSGRDPRLCQVIIDESREILYTKGRMNITRHRLGFECSNAGVDRSNVDEHFGEVIALLPRDPDASAQRIREGIKVLTGKTVAVIINDSFGRAGRLGSVGTAIGIAGIRFLEEQQRRDLFGNPSNTSIALIDELAAAASALQGQSDEKTPVVVIRGVHYTPDAAAGIQQILSN